MPTGVDTLIPATDKTPAIPAYTVFPPGAKRGVVVIHEIFGRSPEIDRVGERFAAAGYAAVVPDIFGAMGTLSCVMATMKALNTGEGKVVDVALIVRSWLCAQTGLGSANVGIIGFCFGGGFALAVGRGWGAVSTNYGDVPKNPDVLRQLGPTIGCFGGRDLMFGPNAAKLETRMKAAGGEVEVHTFDDVGHSFLTDGDRPIGRLLSYPLLRIDYKPETAEAGWEKIMDFFDRHLPEGP